MNIFVLGGKGFVGSAFVRVASKRHRVAVITRQNYEHNRGRSCDLLINANGNSKKFLADQDPAAEFDASVASVLRSLVNFPARRYVYLSTINVYACVDDPRRNRETAAIDPAWQSRYGLHKHLAEQVVRRYAASWLICRLGGMVGAGMWKNSIFDILHDRPLRVSAASEYQFMHTRRGGEDRTVARPPAAGKQRLQRLWRGMRLLGRGCGFGGQAAAAVLPWNCPALNATKSTSRSCKRLFPCPRRSPRSARSCAVSSVRRDAK